MPYGYEINDLAKEESGRMFRIIGELVEGFDNDVELFRNNKPFRIYYLARGKVFSLPVCYNELEKIGCLWRKM